MHKFAMFMGRSALVVKELTINRNGPQYVRIRARKGGLVAWLLARLGIDTTTVFDVYENRVEFSEGSLSGRMSQMIPISHVSLLGTGFLKPILLFVWGVVFLLAGVSVMGDTIIGGLFAMLLGIGAFALYFFRRTLVLYAVSTSGAGAILIVKRSLIENVNLTPENAGEIVGIMTQLIEAKAK